MPNNSHSSSRRTVLKSAAWAAPVVVVATAAPAAAANSAMVVATQNAPTRNIATQVLTVSGAVTNSSSLPSTGLILDVQLVLGSNLAASTAAASGATQANWGAGVKQTVVGSTAVFRYTPTSQFAGAGTKLFSDTYNLVTTGGTSQLVPSVGPNGMAVASSAVAFA